MTDRAKAMLLGSFLGDALALGPHWIYDTDEIVKRFGRVGELREPPESGPHGGKRAGDLTHYGDQTLLLLQAIAESGDFDLDRFAERWLALFEDYDGYYDMATRATLKHFDGGAGPASAGSASKDLGGAARVAPLVYRYRGEPEKLAEAARSQTRMTHNHSTVVEAAAFLAEATRRVLAGGEPVVVLEETAREGFEGTPIPRWVKDGLESTGTGSQSAIYQFGQACEIGQAFPGAIHLIGRFQDSLRDALIECAMAGGDSASRGLMVGMILGAWQGPAALPQSWLEALRARDVIEECIGRIG